MKSKIKFSIFFLLTFFQQQLYAGPSNEQVNHFLELKISQWRNLSENIAMSKTTSDERVIKLWQEYDAETDNTSGKTPLAKIMQDDSDTAHKMAWLRRKVIGQNGDPRYSYAYAMALSRMMDDQGDLMKEATVLRWHAQLALKIDGARCVDQSSPQSIAISYESLPQMQQLINHINSMPAKEKAISQLEAIALERIRGERQPFGGLCTSGNLAKSEALKSKGVEATLKDVKDKPRELKDTTVKTINVDTSGIMPKYIDEAQWKLKREELLRKLTDSAAANL
jgi:hypothetical protein